MPSYKIDKVYYWNFEEDEVQVSFVVINEYGEMIDNFDTYTKAERKICEILERDNA